MLAITVPDLTAHSSGILLNNPRYARHIFEFLLPNTLTESNSVQPCKQGATNR